MAILWHYIEEWEGANNAPSLYVPTSEGKAIEKSGVTLSCGLDLGQINENGLNMFHFPKHIKEILIKYLGLKGRKALRTLRVNSRDIDLISKEDSEKIKKRVQDVYAKRIAYDFNYNRNKLKFEDLSDIQQTVVVSIGYQYGTLSRAAPNFLRQVRNGQWEQVINNLKNFTSKKDSKGRMLHKWRRYQEADLLASELNIGGKDGWRSNTA